MFFLEKTSSPMQVVFPSTLNYPIFITFIYEHNVHMDFFYEEIPNAVYVSGLLCCRFSQHLFFICKICIWLHIWLFIYIYNSFFIVWYTHIVFSDWWIIFNLDLVSIKIEASLFHWWTCFWKAPQNSCLLKWGRVSVCFSSPTSPSSSLTFASLPQLWKVCFIFMLWTVSCVNINS